MAKRQVLLVVLVVLALLWAGLVLSACGQEEGQEAREIVDEAGQNALDFADGFCGAIILAPLAIGLAATRRR